MKIRELNFQYLAKGALRPEDRGQAIRSSPDLLSSLPQVGDFVELEQSLTGGASFSGRVRSRLFRYIADGLGVNIVVEEVSDDEAEWDKLIKE